MTPEERERFAAETQDARAKALAQSPRRISEHGQATLLYLLFGSQEQRPAGAP